jgi:signal transduction histidine kinase
VFLNLFMNAMHAMQHDGTLRVITSLTQLDADKLGPHARQCGFLGRRYVIRVVIEDSGPGIKPEDLDRLFDPYFTTKRQGEGTGLGLSVTRNIVTLHQGSIDLENRNSGGARAVLLFRKDEKQRDEKDSVGR